MDKTNNSGKSTACGAARRITVPNNGLWFPILAVALIYLLASSPPRQSSKRESEKGMLCGTKNSSRRFARDRAQSYVCPPFSVVVPTVGQKK